MKFFKRKKRIPDIPYDILLSLISPPPFLKDCKLTKRTIKTYEYDGDGRVIKEIITEE